MPVSASVLESMMVCPAQWFLRDEAGGIERAHQEANVGQLVHALAERVASGELTSGPGDVEELMEHVDAVWDRLHFRTPWSKAREHARVRRALTRFLEWHYGDKRELDRRRGSGSPPWSSCPTGSRSSSPATPTGSSATPTATSSWSTSRPGSSAPSHKSVESHRQLALYQYAVDSGALDAEPSVRALRSAAVVPSSCSWARSTTGQPSCNRSRSRPTTARPARRCAGRSAWPRG